jgi:hypothetical protein
MAEVVTGEIVLHVFEELDLLREKCILVFLCFTRERETFFIRDRMPVFPVLVKPGELPPVNGTMLIGLAVQHVGIDAADGKPVFIDAAFSLFQKPAGSLVIVLCLQGIPGDIERSVLVTELR